MLERARPRPDACLLGQVGANGDKVGYIPLDRFNETAAQEVQDAVKALQKQNVRGIVLDFRGNPGGILDQSLVISNLFLKDGQEIASIRARNGETQPYVAHGMASVPTTPLVVLTDEYTASASEIVAGALQDHDRALILGQTSFVISSNSSPIRRRKPRA